MLLRRPRAALRNLARLREIAMVLARHGFADLAERLALRRFVPLLRLKAAEAVRTPVPERAADVLQELGPTFVKLGQMLSVRPDILPDEFQRAFGRLQDRVRPFPEDEARAVVERSLGARVDERFSEFSPAPLASGSIAQVHAARLLDSSSAARPVVVKIRRPGIEREMEADLSIIRYLAGLAERHIAELRVYRPVEVVDEFRRSLERELDLSFEAASTAKFSSLYGGDPCVVTPEVVWSHTRGDVLTLTRVEGTPLSDMDALERAGLDRKKLARVMADCFLGQFFEHGFFHADPHPGNVVALSGDRIGLVDFGAVGHLTEDMTGELAAALFGLSAADVSMIASVYEEIGVLDEATERRELLADLQELFDRYYGLPSDRVDVRRAFADFVAVARRHRARVPRDLVVFGRALVTALSSVQRLDPEIGVSEVVRPYARRLVVKRLAPSGLARGGARTGYHLLTLLRRLPSDLRSILRKLRQGRLRLEFRHEGLESFASELDRASNRLAFSVVIAAIIIGSSYIMGAGVGPKWRALDFVGLGDVPILGLVGFVFAGVLGLALAWAIWRSGKLGG
jgi:ubiquinone biosynthesis protein